MVRKLLLFVMLGLGQLFVANTAEADELFVGNYYCGECEFPGNGNRTSAAAMIVTFIRSRVTPTLTDGGWMAGGTNPRYVNICNSETCAVMRYQPGTALWIQITPEVTNWWGRDFFENPEDLPSDWQDDHGTGGNRGPDDGGDGGYGINDPFAGCYSHPPMIGETSTDGGPNVPQEIPTTLVCPGMG